MEPFASLASLPRSGVPRLLLNRELVGPFKSRRRKQEDFALSGDLVTSVKEISQLAGWLEELEKLSSSASSSNDPPSNSHDAVSDSIDGDSSRNIHSQSSDKESPSILDCSQSSNLSHKPTVHPQLCTSPLKQPQIMLKKLEDSPELQRSLRKLNKQTEAGLKAQVEQASDRKLTIQRLDGEVDSRQEPTSDEEDVILCASISNMSIT